MRPRLLEHFLSVVLVTLVLAGGYLLWGRSAADPAAVRQKEMPRELASLPDIDLTTAFGRGLLRDALDIYYPGQADRTARIAAALEQSRAQAFSRNLLQSHVKERLTWGKFAQLAGMYAKFLLVYLLVMALTYYGVETIATWRFVQRRRRVLSPDATIRGFGPVVRRLLLGAGGLLASFILFSPAYVIAYMIRTEFSTSSIVFMVGLGVISNGLLIIYSNKFHTFLVTESRKGYVETALAKGLNASYEPTGRDGIPRRALLRPLKRFEGHVFGHIFRNARIQYISSVKEQACFLVTGLIIIEMALNIHGHLSYEMLRQILYRNYDIVIAIVLGIFYTVKATEVVVDGVMSRVQRRYENA